MKDYVLKAGLKSRLINYVDLETPPRYFISGGIEELEEFVELVEKEFCTFSVAGISESEDLVILYNDKEFRFVPEESYNNLYELKSAQFELKNAQIKLLEDEIELLKGK